MDLYGGNAEAEQEVTIRLDRETRTAYICSTWPSYSRKLEKRYGRPKRTTGIGGKTTSAFWEIPVRLISLRSLPKPGVTVTRKGGFTRAAQKEMAVSASKSGKTARTSSPA